MSSVSRSGRVTQADLARRWKFSRQTVSRYCRQGCPLESVEAADAWLISVKGKRPPVEENTLDSAAAEGSAPEAGEDNGGIEGMLARAKETEREMWDLLQKHMKISDGASDRSLMLRNHKEAAAVVLKIEQEVIDIKLRSGELVSMGDVHDLIRHGLAPIRVWLNSLPDKVAVKCNPGNPSMASVAIRDEVETALRGMEEVVKG